MKSNIVSIRPIIGTWWKQCRPARKALAAECTILLTSALLVLTTGRQQVVRAQSAPPIVVDSPLGSLKTAPTPEPGNLNHFLKTDVTGAVSAEARTAAIALGKALFWDQAVGSDSQACASCHFNAGADSRSKNQIDPGFRAIPPVSTFEAPFTANYQLYAGDFPFFTQHPGTHSVVSSQGVTRAPFLDIVPGSANDLGAPFVDPVFNSGGQNVRGVEARNTPTVINAVFNYRNFWDGRARNEFNGVDPIGDLNPFARVLLAPTASSLEKVRLSGDLRLENASLASQSVGPPLSDLEMSFANRTFAKLGKKMLSFRNALSGQLVAPDDSVFDQAGAYPSQYPQPGISPNYRALIRAAFQPRWWHSNQVITFPGTNDPDGTVTMNFQEPPAPDNPLTTSQFTQMEVNFSLFWGIAVQMYEATLRADDTPFDRAFDSGNPMMYVADNWGAQEKLGLQVFQGKARCIACHSGPELTNASVRNVQNEKLERMIMGNRAIAVYDNGFYNTAVTRCAALSGPCDDVGIGATIGPLNLPLSFSRFFQLQQNCDFGTDLRGAGCLGAPLIKPRPLENIGFQLFQPFERVAVDGAFKTPGLRNVKLTAPYFHNGGDAALMQVIDFYDRGGNFAAFNHASFDPNIVALGLMLEEKLALVALLEAMTDVRVENQKAPFDHPQLCVPNLPPIATEGACAGRGEVRAVGRTGSEEALSSFHDNLLRLFGDN